MINVIDLPLERAWKNSPVIKLVLNDTRYMAMFDSGAMIPMYFDDNSGRLLVDAEQSPDMYVRTPYIVRKDGTVFNLYASSDDTK